MGTRLVLYNFIPGFAAPFLERLRDPLQIEHAEIVDGEPITPPAGFRSRVHNINALHFGDYEVDWSRLRPLDEDLLRRMAPYEVMALRIADKLGKIGMRMRRVEALERRGLLDLGVPIDVGYDERKAAYLKHLRFWSQVIEEQRINLYIATHVPHVGLDYIVYGLSRLRGVRFLTFESIGLFGRVRLLGDLEHTTRELRQRYEELLRKYDDAPHACQLSERSERIWSWQTERHRDPTPAYMKLPGFGLGHHAFGGARTLRRAMQAARRARLSRAQWRLELAKLWVEVLFVRRTKALRRYYAALAKEADLGARYVYVPLHYQPELSSAPLGGAFVEPQNIVHMLAATLPEDVQIYVKEHPAQTVNGRSRWLYDELRRVPRVWLIPAEASTFRLIERALAVATCTGTAGWEALFRGRPVLVFGEVCYQAAPGAFRIRTFEDCRQAVAAILTGSRNPDPGQLRIFLRAMEDCSRPGYVAFFGPSSLEDGDGPGTAESVESACELVLRELAPNPVATAPAAMPS